jgi:4-amino-4-deoxy-L-arabinose transferase-like glycosyltransferase
VGEYFNSATSPLNPYNHGGSFVYGTLPLFLVKFVGQILKVGGDSIHLLGRVLAGLFDLVTVVLMFLIGRKLYSTRIGLLAAFLSACLVISIQQAHFFTMDSFAATFVAATFYSALWVAERGKWSDFVAMGAW